MRLLLFSIFVVFVNGLKHYDIPNLLVNVTEPGVAWFSLPEENIKSVFFSIKRNDTCHSYDYKCDPKEVHPWAIHEFLNQTLTIDAILETNQNETIIGSFKVKSNGASEKQKYQSVKKIIKLPLNSSLDESCSKFRKGPNVCIPSISKVGNTPVNCSGELLFSDSFEKNMDNWKHYVIHRAEHPYCEGVSFKMSKENSYIENETLHLKVTNSTRETFLENCSYIGTDEVDGNLKCGTRDKKEERYYRNNLLPPFQAAMLQSKTKFRHVRIDIEAQVARGDFLFSGMQLATENDAINIAIVRGNSELKDTANNEVGGKTLFAGVLRKSPDKDKLEPHEADQFFPSDEHFGKTYHTYSAIWKSDSIRFKLNGQTYAIFDNKEIMEEISLNGERHIQLFLTVGGELHFPDSRIVKGGNFVHSNPKISSIIKSHVNSSSWVQPKLSIRSIRVYSTDKNDI